MIILEMLSVSIVLDMDGNLRGEAQERMFWND